MPKFFHKMKKQLMSSCFEDEMYFRFDNRYNYDVGDFGDFKRRGWNCKKKTSELGIII